MLTQNTGKGLPDPLSRIWQPLLCPIRARSCYGLVVAVVCLIFRDQIVNAVEKLSKKK